MIRSDRFFFSGRPVRSYRTASTRAFRRCVVHAYRMPGRTSIRMSIHTCLYTRACTLTRPEGQRPHVGKVCCRCLLCLITLLSPRQRHLLPDSLAWRLGMAGRRAGPIFSSTDRLKRIRCCRSALPRTTRRSPAAIAELIDPISGPELMCT